MNSFGTRSLHKSSLRAVQRLLTPHPTTPKITTRIRPYSKTSNLRVNQDQKHPAVKQDDSIMWLTFAGVGAAVLGAMYYTLLRTGSRMSGHFRERDYGDHAQFFRKDGEQASKAHARVHT